MGHDYENQIDHSCFGRGGELPCVSTPIQYGAVAQMKERYELSAAKPEGT